MQTSCVQDRPQLSPLQSVRLSRALRTASDGSDLIIPTNQDRRSFFLANRVPLGRKRLCARIHDKTSHLAVISATDSGEQVDNYTNTDQLKNRRCVW